jgi:hypothetical protein
MDITGMVKIWMLLRFLGHENTKTERLLWKVNNDVIEVLEGWRMIVIVII